MHMLVYNRNKMDQVSHLNEEESKGDETGEEGRREERKQSD